jgi:hypothetical protein
VVEAVRRARGTGFLTLPLLGGDNRLQIPTLATLLAPVVAIGGLRDLLRLVYRGLLDVGAIHGGREALAVRGVGGGG